MTGATASRSYIGQKSHNNEMNEFQFSHEKKDMKKWEKRYE